MGCMEGLGTRVSNLLGNERIKSRLSVVSNITSKAADIATTKDPADRFRVVGLVAGPFVNLEDLANLIAEEYKYKIYDFTNPVKSFTSNSVINAGAEIAEGLQVGSSISPSSLIKTLKIQLLRCDEKKILLLKFPNSPTALNDWERDISKMCTLRAVIYLELTEDKLRERLEENGCTGGEIEAFMTEFNDGLNPAMNILKAQGKVIAIDPNKTVEEMFRDVQAAFTERKLFQ